MIDHDQPNESSLLDPVDPLFVKLGQAIATEQRSVYTQAGVWPVPPLAVALGLHPT